MALVWSWWLVLLRELVGVCGWKMALEYQMAALQAVTAQHIGGDTLQQLQEHDGANLYVRRWGGRGVHKHAAAV